MTTNIQLPLGVGSGDAGYFVELLELHEGNNLCFSIVIKALNIELQLCEVEICLFVQIHTL